MRKILISAMLAAQQASTHTRTRNIFIHHLVDLFIEQSINNALYMCARERAQFVCLVCTDNCKLLCIHFNF